MRFKGGCAAKMSGSSCRLVKFPKTDPVITLVTPRLTLGWLRLVESLAGRGDPKLSHKIILAAGR